MVGGVLREAELHDVVVSEVVVAENHVPPSTSGTHVTSDDREVGGE